MVRQLVTLKEMQSILEGNYLSKGRLIVFAKLCINFIMSLMMSRWDNEFVHVALYPFFIPSAFTDDVHCKSCDARLGYELYFKVDCKLKGNQVRNRHIQFQDDQHLSLGWGNNKPAQNACPLELVAWLIGKIFHLHLNQIMLSRDSLRLKKADEVLLNKFQWKTLPFYVREVKLDKEATRNDGDFCF